MRDKITMRFVILFLIFGVALADSIMQDAEGFRDLSIIGKIAFVFFLTLFVETFYVFFFSKK